jgi:dihydroorotate dehydrogenase
MDPIIKLRNSVSHFIYTKIVKHILFLFDAELMHQTFIKIGQFLNYFSLTRAITRVLFSYKNKMLEQTLLGIKFENPVGLSAGFDKNGVMVNLMSDVGFGFAEIGSITAKAHSGNTGCRLERLKKQKALWVNFGLNNQGVDKIALRLSKEKIKIPFAVSVAKTNSKDTVPLEKGIADYIYTLKTLEKYNIGNFYVLNISCPNSFGGRDFSSPDRYEKLLKEISKLNIRKPLITKLSPDLSKNEIDKILKISEKYKISGFICSNLTKTNLGKGGVSGKLVQKKSDALLSYVHKALGSQRKNFVLIGTGGISDFKDAFQKIKLGANLVQLMTGMIYEGPGLIGQINYELTKLLKKSGFSNIKEAVGKA